MPIVVETSVYVQPSKSKGAHRDANSENSLDEEYNETRNLGSITLKYRILQWKDLFQNFCQNIEMLMIAMRVSTKP